MLPEKMEQGFEQNLKAIQLLQNALGTSFLEAYVENAENLIDNYQVRVAVSYTHLRAHETDSYLVCRLLLEKKKNIKKKTK